MPDLVIYCIYKTLVTRINIHQVCTIVITAYVQIGIPVLVYIPDGYAKPVSKIGQSRSSSFFNKPVINILKKLIGLEFTALNIGTQLPIINKFQLEGGGRLVHQVHIEITVKVIIKKGCLNRVGFIVKSILCSGFSKCKISVVNE